MQGMRFSPTVNGFMYKFAKYVGQVLVAAALCHGPWCTAFCVVRTLYVHCVAHAWLGGCVCSCAYTGLLHAVQHWWAHVSVPTLATAFH